MEKRIPVRLTKNFYTRDVLEVAPALVGKILVRCFPDGSIFRGTITETEAYCGEQDLACHASRGKTARNSVMYESGGLIYIYLIYGMYWMLNFVTGGENQPQAVLIRGIEGCYGPGRLTRQLQIDRSFYGEDLTASQRIWVEDNGLNVPVSCSTRIGIDYAGPIWASKPWRFYIAER